MTGGHEQSALRATDIAIGAAGVTAPWWLQLLEDGAYYFALIGGVLLLTARLYIAWLEIREKRRNSERNR